MMARWEGGQGVGEKGEGIKKYKSVVTERSWGYKYCIENRVAKEYICMIPGHGQRCGDCLREWWGRVEGDKGKIGTTITAQTIKYIFKVFIIN